MKNVKKRTFQLKRYKSLSSTNSELKSLVDHASPWLTIITDEQTNGRGRYQRKWISQPGKDLTFSTLFPLCEEIMPFMPNITQLAALAVVKSVETERIKAQIKWPNDIVVKGRKMCGILVEGVTIGCQQNVIVGIGLNVNSKSQVLENNDTTTMFEETGKVFDLYLLLERIITELQTLRDILIQRGISYFTPLLNYYCAYKNEQRTLTINSKTVQATILSVTPTGALSVSINGEIKEIISGEISFKK